jgi:alpha-L-fucosidase 2
MKTSLTSRTFLKTSSLGVSAILIVTMAGAAPLMAIKDAYWDALKLVWNKPDTSNGENGIPVGNGHIGARIRGGVETETLTLNDKWFWPGGPGLTPPDPIN